MYEDLDAFVLHNTRLTRRHRRAIELLALRPGLTIQGITDDAVAAYLGQHYPGVLAVVGDEQAELEMARQFVAEKMSK